MAKALLNMMTHSISSYLEPYLTYDDSAARALCPIMLHLNEPKIKDSGTFYKDYHTIDY